jgi:hypothetical protein
MLDGNCIKTHSALCWIISNATEIVILKCTSGLFWNWSLAIDAVNRRNDFASGISVVNIVCVIVT